MELQLLLKDASGLITLPRSPSPRRYAGIEPNSSRLRPACYVVPAHFPDSSWIGSDRVWVIGAWSAALRRM